MTRARSLVKRLARAGGWLALAFALGCSSQTPLTEIDVTVKAAANLRVPDDIDQLRIDVGGVVDSNHAHVMKDLTSAAPDLGKLSIVRDNGPNGPITITATGLFQGASVIERSIRMDFTPHQTTSVMITLDAKCLMVFCDPDWTCEPVRTSDQGECRPLKGVDAGVAGASAGMGAAGMGAAGMGSAGMGTSGSGTGGRNMGGMGGRAGMGGRGAAGMGGMGGSGGAGGSGGTGMMQNQAPSCRITTPTQGQSLTAGSNSSLQGTCTDPESGVLITGITWTTSLSSTPLGTSSSISVPLDLGAQTLELCALDPADASLMGCDSVAVTVNMPPRPTGTIMYVSQLQSGSIVPVPAPGPFLPGMQITMQGSGTPQPVTYAWSDSFIGQFATSAMATLTTSIIGQHRITFVVTDAFSQSSSPQSKNFAILPQGQSQLVQPLTMVNGTLGNGAVNALAVDPQGLALAGTSTAVYRFDLASVTPANAGSVNATLTLDNSTGLHAAVSEIDIHPSATTADSLVYLATGQGLLVCSYAASTVIDNTMCTNFVGMDIPDNQVNAVIRVTGSNATEYLVLGTKKGLFVTTTLAGSSTATATALKDEDIAGLAVSGSFVWVASRSTGLNRYDPATNMVVNRNNDGPSQAAQAIAIDSTGMIWVGTDNGLGRFDPVQRQWTTWRTGDPPAPGVASNMIHSLAVANVTLGGTPRDVIWIGTTGGVSRFDPTVPSFMKLTTATGEGLPSNNVLSIAVLANGNKLFGTDAGLALYVGD